jgi:hypothetical protein
MSSHDQLPRKRARDEKKGSSEAMSQVDRALSLPFGGFDVFDPENVFNPPLPKKPSIVAAAPVPAAAAPDQPDFAPLVGSVPDVCMSEEPPIACRDPHCLISLSSS